MVKDEVTLRTVYGPYIPSWDSIGYSMISLFNVSCGP